MLNESDSEDESTDDESDLMNPVFENSTLAGVTDRKSNKVKVEIIEDVDPSTSGVLEKSTLAESTYTLSKSNKIEKAEIIGGASPSMSGIVEPSTSSIPIGQPSVSQLTAQYNSYVNILVRDSDEEDVEMAAAIQASLEDQNRVTLGESSKVDKEPLEVIREFISKNIDTVSDDYVNIIINRKNILSSTFRAIERKAFSFNREVHVTFSGEDGVDSGGPRREYFRLLMLSLKTLGVFQGSWFSHDLQLLHSRKYELAGKLIGWSILQGGPGLKHLSQDAYCVLSDLPYERELALQAIGDVEMHNILSELNKCTNDEMFAEFKKSNADVIANHGYSGIYTCDRSKKGDIEHCLLKQAFVFSVHAEIEQFKKGLNSIGGFGDIVMNSAEVFHVVLSKDNNDKPSFQSFKNLYRINYSEDGSNDGEKEEKTMYCFEVFLQDLEENEADDLSLCDLLIFMTAADSVPPLGFHDNLTVDFYDQEDQVKRLPWSSTCSLTLYLPRGFDDTQEFKLLMKMALINGIGFGKC